MRTTKTVSTKWALIVALAAAPWLAPAANAQAPTHPAPQTGPASEASPLFKRYHDMPRLMASMSDEMARMQSEMQAGPLTAEAERDMAKRMEIMARLMKRMSGFADRPSMSDPELKREYEQMQREMDAMAKAHSGARGPAR